MLAGPERPIPEPQDAASDAPAWDADIRRGYLPPRRGFLAKRGFYAPTAPGAPSTTRQAEILNTAVIAAPTDDEGILVGRDTLSRTPVAHDPITAYNKRIVDSPNVVCMGDVGSGKSSLLKTVYVARPLLLKGRRVCVIDKKAQGEESEYARLCREMGYDTIRLRIGSDSEGSTLNMLDPLLLGGDKGGGRYATLRTVAELSQSGKELTSWEGKALRMAYRYGIRTAERAGRVPVIPDVIEFLGNVDIDEFKDLAPHAKRKMNEAGLTVKFLLDKLVSDELEGLFDRETSKDVRLDGKLTVFDISRLPESGPALTISMMLINVWLLGIMKKHPGWQTNCVVEEGWHLVGGPSGKVIQSNAKLARAHGLSNIVSLHHVSDIPKKDPAIAFIKEAQTVHLYRQGLNDDARMCERLFSLKPGTAKQLQGLPNGRQYLKIGTRPEMLVEHTRSRWEVAMTDTNEALDTQRHQNS
ncbi:ATP/GTP-binding protein [Subtercola vilae]|uniref:ATP/GTP-binding protein n=1 Tax=Subtercola vilae TaxID=2056433 RepID=A0A4T2BRT4_9MICO|nr:ATP/GTP-binding protein [Subtercola vilae]